MKKMQVAAAPPSAGKMRRMQTQDEGTSGVKMRRMPTEPKAPPPSGKRLKRLKVKDRGVIWKRDFDNCGVDASDAYNEIAKLCSAHGDESMVKAPEIAAAAREESNALHPLFADCVSDKEWRDQAKIVLYNLYMEQVDL